MGLHTLEGSSFNLDMSNGVTGQWGLKSNIRNIIGNVCTLNGVHNFFLKKRSNISFLMFILFKKNIILCFHK